MGNWGSPVQLALLRRLSTMVAVTKAAMKAIQVLVCRGDNMDCHWGTLGGTAGHSQSINQFIDFWYWYYPTWSRHILPCMALNERRYYLLYTCTVPTCVVNELHPVRDEEQVRPADVGLPLLQLPHQSWEKESLKSSRHLNVFSPPVNEPFLFSPQSSPLGGNWMSMSKLRLAVSDSMIWVRNSIEVKARRFYLISFSFMKACLELPASPTAVTVLVSVRWEVKGRCSQDLPAQILQFIRKKISVKEKSAPIPEIKWSFGNI